MRTTIECTLRVIGVLSLGIAVACSGAPTAIEGKGGARGLGGRTGVSPSGGQDSSGGTSGPGASAGGTAGSNSGGAAGSGGTFGSGGGAGSGGTSVPASSGGSVSGGSASSGGSLGSGTGGAVNRDAGRDSRPDSSSGAGGSPGTGGRAGTGGSEGPGSTLAAGTGGRLGTGGSPGTGGRPGTGGAPGTGGSTDSAFDWGSTAYNASGGSGVKYQGHYTGQLCINPACHRHNIGYGGTVYLANGTSTAGNIQIGIRSGNSLTTTYSGTQGNFYGSISGVTWSTAQIAIRNASGTAVMPTNASASGECNSCHGASNRIVVP